jgi:branched-subunit amino acid ABC-type transport system permease component
MFLYGLMFWLMLLSQMETQNSFGGSTTEANKITYALLALFLFVRPRGILGRNLRLEAQA